MKNQEKVTKTAYDFYGVNSLGENFKFNNYEESIMLIVNMERKSKIADSNIKGLNELYKKHGIFNFIILGFICNEFTK